MENKKGTADIVVSIGIAYKRLLFLNFFRIFHIQGVGKHYRQTEKSNCGEVFMPPSHNKKNCYQQWHIQQLIISECVKFDAFN